MHVYQIPKASTNISVELRIIDSTDGTPETGVVFNTTGLALEYRRDGAASTAITEVTLAALTTAHADGGFLHIGNGVYRFDLPDAALATGVDKVAVHGTVTGMVVIGCVIQLTSYDPFDAVRLGLTALPNAAADAAGGLVISDAGAQDFDALNTAAIRLTAARAQVLTDWVDAGRLDLILDIIAADTTTDIPATITTLQTSINSLAATPGVGARPFVPSTITVTAGTNASGDASDLANDDAAVYTLDDNAGTLTLDFDYQLDPNTEVIQFLLVAAAQGNTDDITLQFYDQVGATYDTIDTLTGANSLTYATFDKVTVSQYTDDTGLFQVRLTGTGLGSATLTVNKAVAYGVGTVTGIPNGSTVTLGATAVNTNYIGQHWTLALGGQDITGSFFQGADVSGTATSTGDYEFQECDLGAVTLDNDGHFERCGLNGTFTVGQAGTFTFHQCFSEAAAGVPIDFGALGATTVNLYDFHGDVALTNMAAGDIAHVTGNGVITTATCTGGTIDHDGFFDYTDAGGNVTENLADIENDVQATLVDTNELQTDWVNGGRLDLLLDAIPTTAMRGTDSAATATALATAQTDLDTITGGDGVTLATSQPNYAPNVVVPDAAGVVPAILDDLAIKRNTAFSNFEFLMVLSSDNVTPATGLTVTGQRSIDGAAFANVGGTIAEVSNGIYQFDALAADTNGIVITWRFSSATANDTFVTFQTVV